MCVFCNLIENKTELLIVYENNNIIGFLYNDPINEGHVLLVPKHHYLDVDDLPVELLNEIMLTSKKIVKALKKVYKLNGYSIMQSGGVFNEVGHYHLHIFPRYINDEFAWISSNKHFEYSQNVANKILEAIDK